MYGTTRWLAGRSSARNLLQVSSEHHGSLSQQRRSVLTTSPHSRIIFGAGCARRRYSSSACTSTFKYKPLAENHGTIRLLEVLPAISNESLKCRLRHETLTTNSKFETLSYRWGNPNDQVAIDCDGANLFIPRTLESSLRGVRRSDSTLIIWADAACINQANLHEKERQVQLMRVIYSQSQRTLIWLGDQGNLDISWTARVPILLSLGYFRRRVEKDNIPLMRFNTYRTGESKPVSPLSSEGYLAFVNILRNPWFRRAWVVQEVAVSRNPTIIWNDFEIPWSDVVCGLEFLSKMDFGLAFIPSLQHVASIESERQRYHGEQGDLLGILQRHQRCEATDDRDKVFAFAGLTKTLPKEVEISYEKSASRMYIDVAKGILAETKSLALLSQPATMERLFEKILPSWVPDWSLVRSVKMSHSWGLEALALGKKRSFAANGSMQTTFAAAPALKERPKLSLDGLGLELQGCTFDTITDLGDTFEGIELPPPVIGIKGIINGWLFTSRTYMKAQRTLMGWEALASARTPDGRYEATKESILEAYWKTVSAGDYPYDHNANIEVAIWNKVNRTAWRMRKLKLENLVVLPYSILLSIWQAVSKGPAFKFHIQGHYTLHRRLARTNKGFLALVQTRTRLGDVVVLARGSNVPLVLRRQGENWKLVGDAYVHGIMLGEGWDGVKVETMTIR